MVDAFVDGEEAAVCWIVRVGSEVVGWGGVVGIPQLVASRVKQVRIIVYNLI